MALTTDEKYRETEAILNEEFEDDPDEDIHFRVIRSEPLLFEAHERLTALLTAPDLPAGTGREQSYVDQCICSIAEDYRNLNYEDSAEGGRAKAADVSEKARRPVNPNDLETISMNELYDSVYTTGPALIDGFLYAGTYLFAGAPKVGKSFMMAQLAYHVSTGRKLWDYEVHQAAVLYLALEDDYRRLQKRLSQMFGVNGTDHLYLAIHSKVVGAGLIGQLDHFLKEHSDTRLIIIDTLQKVREAVGDGYSYSNDYEVIGALKEFADRHGVCILLVHHTRKTPAGDQFDMISGTTGLLGCADGAFLMRKEKRTDTTVTLDIVGRDQPDQKLYLTRDTDTLVWILDHAESEIPEERPDPLLGMVAEMLTKESPEWSGTATELAAILGTDIAANALSRQLNVNAGILLSDFGIWYSCGRKRTGRWIELKRIGSVSASSEGAEIRLSDTPQAEMEVPQSYQSLPEEKQNM